jgi:hypothetical protein
MFVGDVHGGTLLYRKSLWQQGVRYPETNLAEDAMLIRRALQRGMRLERMSDPSMFIYMRHNCNAWQFAPGEFLQPEQWSQVEAPPSFRQILLYKEAQSQAASYALASGNRQISTPRSIGKSKIHSPDGNVGWSLASASENR